jgi:hypothetical protein
MGGFQATEKVASIGYFPETNHLRGTHQARRIHDLDCGCHTRYQEGKLIIN